MQKSDEGKTLQSSLTTEQIEELQSFDTCLIADAIESFGVRLRNEGFATAEFRCWVESPRPMVGYAATCKVRSADPPIVGARYVERTDWWNHIEETPAPRVLVMQDIDHPPGTGAYFGKVHAHVLMALGCVGVITNGGARELSDIEAAGFYVYAGRIAVSRAYIHIVEFGRPVELGGLRISPGDLIHGDRNGFLTVPPELVTKLPAVARAIAQKKQHLIDISREPGTTHDALRRGLSNLHEFDPESLHHGAKK
jgi:regulator of RNase E activity RraA